MPIHALISCFGVWFHREAALFLHTTLLLRGGAGLVAADFHPAFAAVAALSLLSVPFFLRMSPDAGAELSGRAAGLRERA
jgi:hypothetical protein